MIKGLIMLPTIEDVKEFVRIVTKYNYDVDLSSGRYYVDAKSVLGIFSLDLTKPLELIIHADKADDVFEELKQYFVE